MKRLASLLLVLCLFISTAAFAEGKTYGEAPALAAEVAAGTLLPVEERLPIEPYVSKAGDIGIYGGTYRAGGFGPTHGQVDTEGLRMVGLMRILPDTATTEPFIIKGYDVNADFTEYVLHLREGMKWSDGAPYTADDFVFWYEDIATQEEVYSVLTTGITNVNMWKTAEVTKLDDYTVVIKFVASSPSFITKMQRSAANDAIWAPKHYLSQYHIKYNENANQLAKDEGYENWQLCFAAHMDRGQTTKDYGPDITPWVLYNIDDTGNKYFKRNPYYFVVDAQGNQLPYIDEQMSVIVADAQTRILKLINGELDAAGENPLPVADYTLYKENEGKGNYTVYLFDNSRGGDSGFTFNQTIADPTLRSLFTNVTFREAMSLAIDRDMINETLYFGLATVRQAVPPANTSFYEDWMGEYMTQYDPDGATQRLESLGCVKGTDGVFLMPDGKPFSIILESTEEFNAVGEMVAEMWTAIGVKTTYKQQERSFARERYTTNERQAQVFTFDGVAEPTLYGDHFNKMRPAFGRDEIGQAPLWDQWFSSQGAKGEEPPAEIIELYNNIEKVCSLPMGSPEYLELGNEILTYMTKQLFFIGCTVAPRVIILNNDLGNVPTEGIFAYDYNFWYPFNGDAWFFKTAN